jgi:hypothetical protein
MGLSASIVLVAVGAVLRYAVTATVTGIRIHVVGDIVMGVGVFGLVLWFIFWAGSSYEARRRAMSPRDLPRDERSQDDEETRRVA